MSKHIGETSYKETAFGIIPRSKLIPLEIEGTKRAWDLILKQHLKEQIALSSAFLKKLHRIAFGWIFPEIGGKFRNIEVSVSDHNPPKSYLVPLMMTDFLRDLKIRKKQLKKHEESQYFQNLLDLLSWSHHRFLWIHPFTDYNGRIARLLTNIILLNLDLPPLELKIETKAGRIKYIKALKQADRGYYAPLKKLFEDAFEEVVKSLKN